MKDFKRYILAYKFTLILYVILMFFVLPLLAFFITPSEFYQHTAKVYFVGLLLFTCLMLVFLISRVVKISRIKKRALRSFISGEVKLFEVKKSFVIETKKTDIFLRKYVIDSIDYGESKLIIFERYLTISAFSRVPTFEHHLHTVTLSAGPVLDRLLEFKHQVIEKRSFFYKAVNSSDAPVLILILFFLIIALSFTFCSYWLNI